MDFARIWLNCPVHLCVSPNLDAITFGDSRVNGTGNEDRYQIALKGNYVLIISEGLGASIEHSFPRLISNVYKRYFDARNVQPPFPRGNFDAMGSYLFFRWFYKYDEKNKHCHVWKLDLGGDGQNFDFVSDSTNHVEPGRQKVIEYFGRDTFAKIPCRATEVVVDFINEELNYHRKFRRRHFYYNGEKCTLRLNQLYYSLFEQRLRGC